MKSGVGTAPQFYMGKLTADGLSGWSVSIFEGVEKRGWEFRIFEGAGKS